MKISTDAILLGTLTLAEKPTTILDVGTGTGVIALMMAQRFPNSSVTAIEIDEDAAGQAAENFHESKFSERLSLFQGRFQDFPEQPQFDLIVSNPPFFPDHLKSSDSKRNKALHTDELSFSELIEKTGRLLLPQGSFWVILPPRQMKDFESLAEKSGLFPFQKVRVKDSPSKPIYREIHGFSFAKMPVEEIEISLKAESGQYTKEYSKLLSGFLLGY